MKSPSSLIEQTWLAPRDVMQAKNLTSRAKALLYLFYFTYNVQDGYSLLTPATIRRYLIDIDTDLLKSALRELKRTGYITYSLTRRHVRRKDVVFIKVGLPKMFARETEVEDPDNQHNDKED